MLQFFKNLWPPPSGKKFRTPRPHPAGLGTFLGVFTPTILTILGVIMYLRFGWVVGEVGIGRALLIVAMANLITLITSLCLSAVATNTRVGVGGAYFIISRSLGVDIGAAIGFPLFLSQALSVTLYSFGLAESLRIVWPGVPIPAATVVIIRPGNRPGLSRGWRGAAYPDSGHGADRPLRPRPGPGRPHRLGSRSSSGDRSCPGGRLSGSSSPFSFRQSPASWRG
jgi:hypothetical protein